MSRTCLISILFVGLMAAPVFAAAPAMEWHQSYNGSGEESHPHYVIETSDGGFLMVGETGFIPNSAKIYVVKTNSSGGLIWQKEFGSSGYNLGNGCVETPDGNYVIAGTLNYDAVLIKVNASNGSTISGWPKTWNLGSEDSFEAVENTQDGGLIATGYRNGLAESTFLNWGQGNLIKTDADGNQIWNKDISAYMHSGYRIVRISDGYMVSGHPATEGQPDYNLMKFDFDGNVVWYKTPYAGIYWGFDIDASGNMILAGHVTDGPLSNNHDIMTVKVDSGGNVLWTEYAGQPRGYDGQYIHDEAWGARATPDGGWIVTAGSGDEYSYSECGHPLGCSDQWIVYCLKYSSSGTLEWEGLYGGPGDWAGEDVCMTSDGGALVANDCGAFGFLKLEPFSGAPDTTPPTPDPMTWQTVPYATGDSSIAMVATTASDPSGVEYYFSCISGGGHDSLWQNDTFYEDTGLLPDTSYTYTTKARDKSVNQNQTAESTAESATTDPADTTPPTPDPMTWASVPAAVSSSAIEMTATTASDPSGVEYYFMETSANQGGSDSGWQDSASYTDTGLNASTQYCYEVQARDKSVNQNLTGWSTNECATTQAGGGTWIKVDDRDASVTYTGSTWHQTNPSTAYMNTATYTQDMGISATYSFTGTQVRFYVWQYDTSQGYDVYIDDQFQQTVNVGSGSETSIQAWESGTLADTAHTLRLQTASGEPHVDAFEHFSGGGPDTDPPSPDPMTWASVPSADSDTAISMTATTATDPSGVEYYFDETSGNPGGSDSGWQDPASYTDTGLNGSTQYCYEVTARDKSANQNETAASSNQCATTDVTPDTTPPTPDPMTWSSVPAAGGTDNISMTATTATDPSGVEYFFDETSGNPGGSDSGWQDPANYTDTGLSASTQYCYEVQARDKSANQNATAASSNQCATTDAIPDTDPPTPDPMTWSSVPAAGGTDNISMTATTATDPSGVEYFFDETSGNPGGSDSGWQDPANYSDTGLSPDTQYCYEVQARDKSANQNATAYSSNECATTDPLDTTPPTPDPMTWSSVPAAGGGDNISMTATTASDPSGVEYFFDETSGNPGGSDSGWQDPANYTDDALSQDTQYCYRVQARDKSVNQNATAFSTTECDTTPTGPAFADNFESATDWNNNWTAYGAWQRVTARSYDGSYSAEIDGVVTDSALVSAAIDVAGKTDATVTFAWYIEGSLDAGEYLRFDVDTGSGWVQMASLDGNVDPEDVWNNESIPVDVSAASTMSLRFRGTINKSNEDAYVDVVEVTTVTGVPDTDPPTPDPMTWASAPSADSASAISMTATTATDPSGVSYYFDETSGNPGGSDSGWQPGTGYTDDGLNAGTQYCYQVKARDNSANQNETGWSSILCDTTPAGCSPTDCHVEAMVCSEQSCGGPNKNGVATVTIYDDCGDPVVGADVTGTFTGSFNEQVMDTTDGNGVAVLVSTGCLKKPTFEVCVDDVDHTLPYDSNDNLVSCCND